MVHSGGPGEKKYFPPKKFCTFSTPVRLPEKMEPPKFANLLIWMRGFQKYRLRLNRTDIGFWCRQRLARAYRVFVWQKQVRRRSSKIWKIELLVSVRLRRRCCPRLLTGTFMNSFYLSFSQPSPTQTHNSSPTGSYTRVEPLTTSFDYQNQNQKSIGEKRPTSSHHQGAFRSGGQVQAAHVSVIQNGLTAERVEIGSWRQCELSPPMPEAIFYDLRQTGLSCP